MSLADGQILIPVKLLSRHMHGATAVGGGVEHVPVD